MLTQVTDSSGLLLEGGGYVKDNGKEAGNYSLGFRG